MSTTKVAFENLTRSEQHRLVCRIVKKKHRKLMEDYPGLVGVWAGHRSRRDMSASHEDELRKDVSDTEAGPYRVYSNQPSIIFVVEKKEDEQNLDKNMRLPRVLSAYAIVDGRRHRVLVPTDVMPKSFLSGCTPDSGPALVEIWANGRREVEGQLCCAVVDPDAPANIRAIGCRHVLTTQDDLENGKASQNFIWLVATPNDQQHVAKGSPRAGKIRDGSVTGPFSFDAQLAVEVDKPRLSAAIGKHKLDKDNWPKSKESLLSSFPRVWIQTSRGAQEADLLGVQDKDAGVDPIPYGKFNAFHKELLSLAMRDGSRVGNGDSGAAVTSAKDGGQLLGMHIASKKLAAEATEPQPAFAIPVWALLDRKNYGVPPPGEKDWKLITDLGPALKLPPLLTPMTLKDIADKLGCEVAAVEAVAVVESGDRKGFLRDGQPLIRYERHVFRRNTGPVGRFDTTHPHLSAPYDKNFDPGGPQRSLDLLSEAEALDFDAANKACSWGLFQILGENFSTCGFPSVRDFVIAQRHSEDKQKEAFFSFVKGKGLDVHLRNKDWTAFAKGYNGSNFRDFDYDGRIKRAYEKFSAQ